MKKSSKSPERSFYNLQVAWLLKKMGFYSNLEIQRSSLDIKKRGKNERSHFAMLISGLTSNWLD